MEDDLADYLNAGADKVLPKPVQIELVNRILGEIQTNDYLSKKTLSRANNLEDEAKIAR